MALGLEQLGAGGVAVGWAIEARRCEGLLLVMQVVRQEKMVDWGQADDVVFGSPTLVHQVDDVGAAQSHAAFKKWASTMRVSEGTPPAMLGIYGNYGHSGGRGST